MINLIMEPILLVFIVLWIMGTSKLDELLLLQITIILRE